MGIFIEVGGDIINAYKISRVRLHNPGVGKQKRVEVSIVGGDISYYDESVWPSLKEALSKVPAPLNTFDFTDSDYRRTE